MGLLSTFLRFPRSWFPSDPDYFSRGLKWQCNLPFTAPLHSSSQRSPWRHHSPAQPPGMTHHLESQNSFLRHLKGSIPKGTVCALEPPCLCMCHFLISPDGPTPLTCLIKSCASFQTSFRAIFLAEPSLIGQMEWLLLGIPMGTLF